MSEKILLVINGVKNFSKYLVIPAGVITFFPDQWLQYVRLLDVKNKVGLWIACLFFITLSIICIDMATKVISIIRKKGKALKERKLHESILYTLNSTDKVILKKIYDNDSANYDLSNSSVAKLEKMDIIFRPEISIRAMVFSYCLHPWVTEFLKKNPGYFKGICQKG